MSKKQIDQETEPELTAHRQLLARSLLKFGKWKESLQQDMQHNVQKNYISYDRSVEVEMHEVSLHIYTHTHTHTHIYIYMYM